MNNNRVNNTKTSNSNNLPFPYVKVNILYVSILILLGVIGYFVYVYLKVKYTQTTTSFIQNEVLARRNGKESKLVLSTDTPVSLYGNEFNISMWVKVLSYNYRYGAPKYILRKGGMEVYLHPTQNNLHIRVSRNNDLPEPTAPQCDDPAGCVFSPSQDTPTTTQPPTTTTEAFSNTNTELVEEEKCVNKTNICNNKVNYKHNELLDKVLAQYETKEGFNEPTSQSSLSNSGSSSTDVEYDECIEFNLPLQKWTHVSMNCFSDNIDVYVDGKLSSSCKLDVIPDINLSNMIISPDGGFEGEVSKVTYSNIKLTSRHIYNLYKSGPL